MIIGHFSYNGKNDTFTGSIHTITMPETKVELRPVQEVSPKGPQYRIFMATPNQPIEVGAAWRRTSNQGREFLAVQLEDPTFPKAMYAAMFFLAENGAAATLVWSRNDKRPTETEG